MSFYRQRENFIWLYFLALLLILRLFSKSVYMLYLCKCAFLFGWFGGFVVFVFFKKNIFISNLKQYEIGKSCLLDNGCSGLGFLGWFLRGKASHKRFNFESLRKILIHCPIVNTVYRH